MRVGKNRKNSGIYQDKKSNFLIINIINILNFQIIKFML